MHIPQSAEGLTPSADAYWMVLHTIRTTTVDDTLLMIRETRSAELTRTRRHSAAATMKITVYMIFTHKIFSDRSMLITARIGTSIRETCTDT